MAKKQNDYQLIGILVFWLSFLLAGSSTLACAAGTGSSHVSDSAAQNFAPTAGKSPRNYNFGVFDVGANKRRAIGKLDDLGVGWVRFQVRMGEKSFDPSVIFKHKMGLWLTLYNRDPKNIDQSGTVGINKAKRGGFPYRNRAAFQDRVRKTITPIVDALRKQGKDPKDWLVVQFNNEMAPSDLFGGDRKARFWHGTADQYLNQLKAGYEAVKSIDPGIPVTPGAVSSEMMERVIKDNGRESKLAQKWVKRLATEGHFDWFDVHLFNSVKSIPAKVSWIRQYWNGPLAASEVGGPDTREGTQYSLENHAVDLQARVSAALKAGVSRLFWIQLYPNTATAIFFRNMSLHDSRGKAKPGYEVYKNIIHRTRF